MSESENLTTGSSPEQPCGSGADASVSEEAAIFLVDGYNLLHAVILSGRDRTEWWTPRRQEQVVRLVERVAGGEAAVVFDSKDGSAQFSGETSVRVEFAPNADDFIVQSVVRWAARRPVVVVTADRALADRAQHRGAATLSPWRFAASLSA